MAKILVADDNSNVQKTVALALADLGVDVVSVNNGEAAVRKLSDFSPDLVLADIFMPVRNGYEVCEYVKKDSRFSHVPVVLLVGAFDPLDEREAQRVGADGILKKPFVPPEPLITMVKTLLDRTLGERLVAVSVSKPAVTLQAKTGGNAIAEMHVPVQEETEGASSPEFPSPAERIAFGEGDRPVAFGQLLEPPAQDIAASNTAVIEPVDDEQILTSSRDATLGDPIFWRNDSPDPEPEVEPVEDIPLGLEARTWKQEEDSLPRRDEAALLQPIEPLELVREEQEESSASIVASEPIQLDAAAQASLTVESDKAKDLAANPIEWMATAPLEQSEEAPDPIPGSDDPIPDADDVIDKVKSTDDPGVLAQGSAQVPVQVSAPFPTPVLTKVSTPELSRISVKPDAAVMDKIPLPQIPAAPASALPKTQATQSTEDTARSVPKQDWAELTATLQSRSSELVTPQVKPPSVLAEQDAVVASGSSQPALASPARSSSPDPALVEAVVQRVLDKMRPQVVDIITKEFLRPIVQALVHREIEKH